MKYLIFILVGIAIGFVIYFYKPSTGTKSMGVLDNIRYETAKLDSLKLHGSDEEIRVQIIRLYEALKLRVEAEKKGLKMLRPRQRKMLKDLKPVVERLKREHYPVKRTIK